jgi:cytidine deaminase
VALYKGLSEGERIFSDLAVVSEQNPPITPCGACRQVLMEFCPTLRIILADLKGNYRIVTLKELMPEPFFHWKV